MEKLPHRSREMSDTASPYPNAATPEIREFLIAAHAFCANSTPKLTPKSLSSIVFDAGRQIERLESGCDLTTGRLRAAWTRLRELEAGGPRTRKPRNSKGASNGEEDQRPARSGV